MRHGGSLKKLHLGCNQISDASVAAVIPHLTRLQELCLEGNRLTTLPEAIGGLGKLRDVNPNPDPDPSPNHTQVPDPSPMSLRLSLSLSRIMALT